MPHTRLQVVILDHIGEGDWFEDRVLGLDRQRQEGLAALLLQSGALNELFRSALSRRVQSPLFSTGGSIVQLESFLEVIAHPDTHQDILGEIAQTTQRVIILKQRIEDVLCALWPDRVLRDIHLVEHLVPLQHVAQVNCELIIQKIAVEVDFG